MKHRNHKSKNSVPTISQEWKDKVLSVIPDTHIGRFVSSGEKRIHIRTVDDTARMTLEWVNGEHDALYIKDLNVSKAHRNKGFGKQLLDMADAIADKTGRFKLITYGQLSKSQMNWLVKNGFVDCEILYAMDTLDGCTYNDDWDLFVTPIYCYIKHLLC